MWCHLHWGHLVNHNTPFDWLQLHSGAPPTLKRRHCTLFHGEWPWPARRNSTTHHTSANTDRHLAASLSNTATGLPLYHNTHHYRPSNSISSLLGRTLLLQHHMHTHEPTICIPMSLELAMRLVATSLMVLCEAPEERMVAARHALDHINTRSHDSHMT